MATIIERADDKSRGDLSTSPRRLASTTRILKLIRRTHMFTGLFMLPWVVVYGMSALVFNHRGWFYPQQNQPTVAQSREVRELPDSFWGSRLLESVGSAEALAGSFLEAVNRGGLAGPSEHWQLAADAEPRFTRNLVLQGSEGGQVLELQLDLNQRAGTAYWSAKDGKKEKPSPTPVVGTRTFKPADAFVLDEAWLGGLSTEFGALNPSTNAAPGSLRVKNAPELVFEAEAEGRRWNVRCNLKTGEIVAREAGAGGSAISSTAGFITRLHRTRGYPANGTSNIRWWWAIIVDATAFLMLIWGVSGVLMWWQMKGQRKWGAVTLVACGVVTWFIWTGMHQVIR